MLACLRLLASGECLSGANPDLARAPLPEQCNPVATVLDSSRVFRPLAPVSGARVRKGMVYCTVRYGIYQIMVELVRCHFAGVDMVEVEFVVFVVVDWDWDGCGTGGLYEWL